MNQPQNPTYVSFKPNYIAIYSGNEFNTSSINFDKPIRAIPKSNDSGRGLSKKARKRLMDKVAWLNIMSKQKTIHNNKTNTTFKFRLNFITLTLPTLQQHHDHTIKSKCFQKWLDEMRKYHGLINYVWRAEAQANGSIHFHIVADSYLHHYIVRNVWNRCIEKLGYVSQYADKFKSMSFEDYVKLRLKEGNSNMESIRLAWSFGIKSNWKSPNTTDIHALYKVKNVEGYLSKYMSKDSSTKDSDDRYDLKSRRLEGRNWGCSQSLSKCKAEVYDRCDLTDSICDYVTSALKVGFKVERYFTLIFADFKDIASGFRSFMQKMISSLKAKIGYIEGSIANKSLQLINS